MVCWPGEPNSIPPLSSSGSSRSFGFHPEEGGWDLSSLPVSVFFFFFFSSFCVAFFYSKRKRKTVTPSFELGSHNYSKAITNARPPGNPHSNKKTYTHRWAGPYRVLERGKKECRHWFHHNSFWLDFVSERRIGGAATKSFVPTGTTTNRMIRQFRLFRPTKAKRLVKKRPKTFALCVPPRVDSNYVTTPPLHTHRTGFEEEG